MNEARLPKVEASEKTPARQTERLSVSILWFENKTGDPQATHWRYAIEGMLSIQLRQIKAVRLRSGVESARKRLGIAKGAALDVDQARRIGEVIEARRVIWGSFRHQGDNWQVTAQVLNVGSGTASADLVATSADWFEVCNNLTDRILNELSVSPSDAEREKMERPLTSSLTALEWYSKAHALQEEDKPLSEQENCARQAIAADPNFAQAYVALAATLGSQGKLELVEGTARQALKIRPDLAYAHTILGVALLFQKRFVESEKELHEAHRLDPDDAETLSWLGELYATQGKSGDAISAFKEAVTLEPMGARFHANLGRAYAFNRERDQAFEELKKAEQLDSGDVEGIGAEQMIGQAYNILNEIPLAVKYYDRFVMLAKKRGLNPELVRNIEKRATELKATLTVTFIEQPMPNVYSGRMLQETLGTKLTKEELAMVVNPVASGPEIQQWALQLTEGTDGDLGKARAIFDGLLRRISVGNTSGMRTAREVFAACNDPNELFNCQESAKLYIAMARDAGLKAFFTVVDLAYDGQPISHVCSAVFGDDKALLVDLSYRWFGVPHKKVVVMDDVQMITIQLCEAAGKEQYRSLWPLAAKLRPDVPISQFALAMALANADEWQEARRMTEAARQVEPEHWMAYLMRGRLSREDGDPVTAESHFRKALAIKPDEANSRCSLGFVLMAQSKLEEAREELRNGLQYGPEGPMAEDARRAIALINESIGEETSQVSKDPNVYLLRAERYWSQGSPDETIAQLDKALALDPKLTEAYYRRGRAYFIKHQYEQAILDFEKVIELNPKHTGAYYDRGISYQRKDELDLAIRDFNKALQIAPENAQIYDARGSAYAAKGRFDQAIIDFTKVIEINPQETEAYGTRGTAYAANGQYEQAVSDLTKALEKNPQNIQLYINRGTAYSGMGEYKRAIADYNKAVELNPRIPPIYYYWRGSAYLKSGDTDRAISDFDTALKINPRDTKALVGLATTLLDKDMHVMAISVSTRAIEIDPELDKAYAIRARAYHKNGKFAESWNDVRKAQELGHEFDPAFLESLRAAHKQPQ